MLDKKVVELLINSKNTTAARAQAASSTPMNSSPGRSRLFLTVSLLLTHHGAMAPAKDRYPAASPLRAKSRNADAASPSRASRRVTMRKGRRRG